jgi:hypothetical protein
LPPLYVFRDYSPTLGRWTSLDPLSYAAGDVNLYRTVGNNPLNSLDPSGLDDVRTVSMTPPLPPPHHVPPAPSPSSYNRPNPTPYQRTLILRCAVCHGTADGQWLPIAAFPELIQYAPPDQRYTLADLNGAALDHRFQANFDPSLPSGPLAEQARLGGSGEVLGTAFSLWADYLFAPLPGSPRSTVGAVTPVIGPARETVAAIQAERYERALFYGGLTILDIFLAKWLANGVVSAWRRAVGSGPGAREPHRIYSARELIRRAEEPGPYHNFPESFNAVIFGGNRQVISENYILYTKRGSINGVEGTYEIGVRPSASGRIEVIVHRFFRPDRRR